MELIDLLVVLLIVAVIALIARVIYRLVRGAMTGGDTRTPEEILEDRYRSGEIDRDEFEKQRRRLNR